MVRFLAFFLPHHVLTNLNSVDNSEWMRNGDYTPTRLEAEIDAVNLVAGAKTQQNAERYSGCLP